MDTIPYDTFARLDIRVAQVLSAEPIAGKTRIMKGVVDLGTEKRTVVIGGAEYHTPESMVGRTVVVLANLEPRAVAGVTSEAMLLAADLNNKPFWLSVSGQVPPGSPVR